MENIECLELVAREGDFIDGVPPVLGIPESQSEPRIPLAALRGNNPADSIVLDW
jgi:hypothetical protein